jgi:hypothetical protein
MVHRLENVTGVFRKSVLTFNVHGPMHSELMSINVQQDAASGTCHISENLVCEIS